MLALTPIEHSISMMAQWVDLRCPMKALFGVSNARWSDSSAASLWPNSTRHPCSNSRTLVFFDQASRPAQSAARGQYPSGMDPQIWHLRSFRSNIW